MNSYARNCYFQESDHDDDDRKDREKQERIEASLRKRQEEVHRSLSTSLRERDKEQQQHRKDEAIQVFNALLADLVSCFLLSLSKVWGGKEFI